MNLRSLALYLGAVCFLAPVHAQVLDVPLDAHWQAVPGWTPNDAAARHSAEFRDGVGSFRAAEGGRVMVWVRNPQPPLDVSAMRFVTLRYRLTDTDDALYSYLLYLDTGESGGMYARNLVFGANDLIHDGQWHVATTTLHPFGKIGTLALRFRALEGREGRLDVAYLRFTAEPPRAPLAEHVDWQPGTAGLAGEPVPLEGLCNTPLPALQKALALSDWFTAPDVTAAGVVFRVATTGNVAASTGVAERQGLVVPVQRRAAALYLLLGASFPYKMLSYEGWAPGDMTERPEQFRVAVRYADGTAEEQVPYCLGRNAYGVWRGVRAYGVPVRDDTAVREIELRDGMRTSSFHLLALTAAQRSLMPPASDPPQRTPTGGACAPTTPVVAIRDRLVVVRTTSGELVLDPARGLAPTAVAHRAYPDWRLKAGGEPLFAVRETAHLWPGDSFRLSTPVRVEAGKACLAYRHDEANLEVEIGIEALGEEARLSLRIRNLADKDRTVDVSFPRVRIESTPTREPWYFYPARCPVWSTADKAFDTAYSGSFPVQFMDVYDRHGGGGVHVGTRDRTVRQRYFQLSKQDRSIALAVDYRANPPLPAGQWVEYPVGFVGLHRGDWRPALDAYLAWFRAAYAPARPRLDWYAHVWNFRTWWTHTMGDGRPEYNLFDAKTGEFQTAAFVKRDREQFGQIDMVHFFDWRISTQYGAYGDFSHYEDIGGLDKFRAAVSALQTDGIRVGLYLDCYLCSRKSLVGQAHGEEWAMQRSDGKPGTNYSTPADPMLNMCVRQLGWQDHLAAACARAVRETGCDGIYLDEGMTDYGAYWCWSKAHGHSVPGTNQAGLLELCRKVRTALPEGKALYTEWSPPDVFIPYLDGAYQASLRDADVHASPGFLQLARFAFPDFRVFTISNGGSMYDGIWEGTKFSLFNGVPLYSLSWGHDEECLPLFRKMSAILHEHAAAFLTRTPQPYVDSEAADVYANAFPAAAETVWTLWNGRYRTYTGPVLKVPHVAGARYVDLWNGKELTPAIEGDLAVLATTLEPRGIGVVAQVRSPQSK